MDKFAAMQTFVRVVESGNFTRAADFMNVPNSTVTRQIQMLEKELNVRLLNRNTRQLTLTQAGTAYYEGALRLLEQLGELDNEVAGVAHAPTGRIRVELSAAIAYKIILPALPSFYVRYPDIDIYLSIGNKYVDLIAENVDCVIRTGHLQNDTLIARPLGHLQRMLCATPTYLAELTKFSIRKMWQRSTPSYNSLAQVLVAR